MIDTALRLRPFVAEDADAFAAVLNTPAMMAHLGGVKRRAEIDALVAKRIADQARDGFSYWAVETREESTLVGTCGVRLGTNYADTPVDGMHELGWRIGEAHWRRGFAREAVEATLRCVGQHRRASGRCVDDDRQRRGVAADGAHRHDAPSRARLRARRRTCRFPDRLHARPSKCRLT